MTNKSVAEWQQLLDAETFRITRCGGTERAFSGEYWNCKIPGCYHCRCCNARLFDAKAKFDSATGWPSFTHPCIEQAITHHKDRKLLVWRTEVRCARCDAHLGHVFNDGPPPRRLRYCINSHSLQLRGDGAEA